MTRRNSEGEETAVYVSVTKCGNAVNGAAVTVDVFNEYDEDTTEYSSKEVYSAQATGTSGEYKIFIPSEPANDNSIQACDAIVSGVETGCQIYDWVSTITKGKAEKGLCAVLATAGFALTKIPSTWTLIYRFCTTAFKGIGVFCDIIGAATKADNVGLDTSELVCGAAIDFIDSFINYFTNQLVLLRPKAIIQGQEVVGNDVTTELEEGQSTSIAISQPHDFPIIDALYTIPADFGYYAIVELSCISDDTLIWMTIYSNNYNTSNSCHGESTCKVARTLCLWFSI